MFRVMSTGIFYIYYYYYYKVVKSEHFFPNLIFLPFSPSDMKSQPESAVHTPFTKRQPYQAATSTSSMLDVFLQDKGLPPSSSSSSLPQQTTSSPHGVPPPASSLPKMTAVPSLGQQVSPSSSDAQSPLPLQQHKLKQQKKRTSITTKVIHLWIHLDRQKWKIFKNYDTVTHALFQIGVCSIILFQKKCHWGRRKHVM